MTSKKTTEKDSCSCFDMNPGNMNSMNECMEQFSTGRPKSSKRKVARKKRSR